MFLYYKIFTIYSNKVKKPIYEILVLRVQKYFLCFTLIKEKYRKYEHANYNYFF